MWKHMSLVLAEYVLGVLPCHKLISTYFSRSIWYLNKHVIYVFVCMFWKEVFGLFTGSLGTRCTLVCGRGYTRDRGGWVKPLNKRNINNYNSSHGDILLSAATAAGQGGAGWAFVRAAAVKSSGWVGGRFGKGGGGFKQSPNTHK